MDALRFLLLVGLLNSLAASLSAQTLPPFMLDRRMNKVYMDSLSGLARQQYRQFSNQPPTAHGDTLRFQALNFLGRLYVWWEGRKDSTLFFADELIQQAHIRHNIEFEVKGILLKEFYYQDSQADYPTALRLNYQAKAILQKAGQDPMLNWRIDLNLGNLYSLSGDYENAIRFLDNARTGIARGSGVGPRATVGYQADIEQKLGIIYEEQHNFSESEKHYLLAEQILLKSGLGTKTNFGYIYEVISALYLRMGDYEKALSYAKKAEPMWQSINEPASITTNWSILAVGYAYTNQNELAAQYAQRVLTHPLPSISARQKAYLALQKINENQRNWQQSLLYYKRYVALTDTIRTTEQSEKLASIEKKNDLELLSLQNQHVQQIQSERLLTIQKQGELDRLRTSAVTFALKKKAQLAEQQRILDNERAKVAQQQQQQVFDLQANQQKEQEQQHQFLFLTTSSLLVLGVLILLLYLVQLRNRKVEAELKLSDERKEANARIIQAQEEERQRLAADLHDDLGATLSAIKGQLETAHQASNKLDQPIDLMGKAIQNLRHIAHNLMPPEFAKLGLTEALRETVRRVEVGSALRMVFITYGQERRLDPETELIVYRIALELINNAIKHAKARQITIQLLYYPLYVSLLVEDDGQGYPTQESTLQAGIGLRNIRSRVTYLKSTLMVDSGERGTTVTVDVPF